MNAKTPKQLPSLKQFVTLMKSHLASVPGEKRKALLESLYQVAEKKVELEALREPEQKSASEFREAHQGMGRSGMALQKILNTLIEAKKRDSNAWKDIEEKAAGEQWEFTFDEIIEHLKNALGVATNMELVYAGQIHPRLRTKREKRLASRKLGRVVASDIVPHPLIAIGKSPVIDQWFIGEAAACLDQYQTLKGKKIARYDKVISKLIEILFAEPERVERVRTSLRRQKQKGRPHDWLSNIQPSGKRRVRILGQKSTRSHSSGKKMSGPNQNN